MIKLYHWPLSPFCRKVRLVLREKNLNAELIITRFWESEPDFLRLNAYGTVPFMRDLKCAIGESTPICEYLEEVAPKPALLPGSIAERAEIRRLTSWFDDRFYRDVGSKLLHERAYRRQMGKGSPDSKAILEGVRNIHLHLDYITHLLSERDWMAGQRMSLADFTAAAHLSSLDYISDVNWTRYPVIKQWYTTMKSRPCFRDVLRDVIPGLPQPPHYADLDF